VVCDFALTCTFLASALVIKSRYFDKEEDASSRESRQPGAEAAETTVALELEEQPGERRQMVDLSPGPAEKGEGAREGWRLAERFFSARYGPWMARHAPKVMVVCAIWLGLALNFAFELEAQKEDPSLWPTDHNQYLAKQIELHVVPVNTHPVMINVNYGVLPEETSMDPLSTVDEEQHWNTAFDMSSEKGQRFMLETCDALTSAQSLVRAVQHCWLYEFREYVSSEYSGGAAGRGTCSSAAAPVGFPVPTALFRDAVGCFSMHRGGHLFDGYNKFIDLDESGNVRYSRIQVWSKISGDESVTEMQEVYDRWEAWMEQRNAKALGAGVGDGFQLDANGKFLQMSTIDSLQSGFAKAAALSISLALCAILLTTLNFVVTAYAIITVVGIVLSMLALMVFADFKLGVLESMCLSILVGVSIDYTLHLALAYQETKPSKPRAARATEAAQHMGISIVSGACSTASSGVLLFFTTITFFTLFGYFIVTTALLSVLFAVFFFMALLYTAGPEGPFGSLVAGLGCVRCKAAADTPAVFAVAEPGQQTETEILDGPEAAAGDAPEERKCSKVDLVAMISAAAIMVAAISVRVVLSAPSDTEVTCEGGTLDLTFPSHRVDNATTSYVCVGIELPKDCTMHVTKMEAITAVDEVHHILLLKAASNLGACPFTCFDMPEVTGFVWGWAVGGGPMEFPPGMGFGLGGTSDAPSVLMQIHYDNWLNKPALTDPGSGIRVHYVGEPLATQVAVLGVGATPIAQFEVPPQVRAPSTAPRIAIWYILPKACRTRMTESSTQGVPL
jgi:hypothetical protein